jgi:putative nucleotidyltransferase with HDIG domain
MFKEKRKKKIRDWFKTSSYIRWIILLFTTAIFISVFYPSLGSIRHSYVVGDVAQRNIKAPMDFWVEDKEATADKQKIAVDKVLTVYDLNGALLTLLTQSIFDGFSGMNALFISKEKLFLEKTINDQNSLETQAQNDIIPVSIDIWEKKEEFEQKIGITIGTKDFSLLEKESFSSDIAEKIISIISEIFQNGVVADQELLLRDSDKGIIVRNSSSKNEKIETDLNRFYGLDQAKNMVKVMAETLLKGNDQNLNDLIVNFSQQLIQPNMTINRFETESRKRKAAESVNPIMFKIKAGEMLLREGDRVTEDHLQKIDALQSKNGQENLHAISIGATALFCVFLMVLYLLNLHHNSLTSGNHNKNLLFLASILIVFILIAKVSASIVDTLPRNLTYSLSSTSIVYGVPIASGAMVICLFMGVEIAVAFALLISVCVTVIFNNQFDLFIYYFLNSAMGAYWVRHCRERKVFAMAGIQLALLNMLLTSCIGLVQGDFFSLAFLWNLAFAFLGGIGAGILTSGIAPLFETLFGYATDITLLELANLERPILRRLMIEAPGTYHHSMIVGSLVEAAASDIDANPLLAKVCGYYHDIGKVKKPLYFIENQSNAKNLHDKLAPSMSRRILIAHVKDGVEMAREHKLPQVVRAAIEQHHGTSLIRYFFDKAVKLQGEKSVKADDYRYPGPNPQTREAGLVMLADVVEAASRTLDNPTPSRIQGLVHNLINKIFSDGQLNDCELTLKDLHSIAKSFNKILNGIHHHRIEYAESSAKGNGKTKNGSSDQQQAKEKKDSNREGTGDGSGHLKRLGLS